MELVFGGSWPSVVYHQASHRLVRPNIIEFCKLFVDGSGVDVRMLERIILL